MKATHVSPLLLSLAIQFPVGTLQLIEQLSWHYVDLMRLDLKDIAK